MNGTLAPARSRGYDDRGLGEPALVCLPGWCGNRSVFDAVADRTHRHRRTLSLDLPEHGTRPRTGADFRTRDVVADVIGLIEDLGVQRVVPVALSHAGWVAIELRRRLGPDRVPGVVLVDWMVLGPPPGFVNALGLLQDPALWADARTGLFQRWTSGLDLLALQDYVADMAEYGPQYWHRAGREIAAAFAEHGSPVAALERLDRPCPTLHLYAQPADPGYLAAQQGYAAAHPWFEVHRLAAAGHFPMFEVPDEMSARIEEFTCRIS